MALHVIQFPVLVVHSGRRGCEEIGLVCHAVGLPPSGAAALRVPRRLIQSGFGIPLGQIQLVLLVARQLQAVDVVHHLGLFAAADCLPGFRVGIRFESANVSDHLSGLGSAHAPPAHGADQLGLLVRQCVFPAGPVLLRCVGGILAEENGPDLVLGAVYGILELALLGVASAPDHRLDALAGLGKLPPCRDELRPQLRGCTDQVLDGLSVCALFDQISRRGEGVFEFPSRSRQWHGLVAQAQHTGQVPQQRHVIHDVVAQLLQPLAHVELRVHIFCAEDPAGSELFQPVVDDGLQVLVCGHALAGRHEVQGQPDDVEGRRGPAVGLLRQPVQQEGAQQRLDDQGSQRPGRLGLPLSPGDLLDLVRQVGGDVVPAVGCLHLEHVDHAAEKALAFVGQRSGPLLPRSHDSASEVVRCPHGLAVALPLVDGLQKGSPYRRGAHDVVHHRGRLEQCRDELIVVVGVEHVHAVLPGEEVAVLPESPGLPGEDVLQGCVVPPVSQLRLDHGQLRRLVQGAGQAPGHQGPLEGGLQPVGEVQAVSAQAVLPAPVSEALLPRQDIGVVAQPHDQVVVLPVLLQGVELFFFPFVQLVVDLRAGEDRGLADFPRVPQHAQPFFRRGVPDLLDPVQIFLDLVGGVGLPDHALHVPDAHDIVRVEEDVREIPHIALIGLFDVVLCLGAGPVEEVGVPPLVGLEVGRLSGNTGR